MHLPSSVFLAVRTFTRPLLCLDSGALTRGPEHRPAGSQHLRFEPSLVSHLEEVADSDRSWWAVMSPCHIYWCSAPWPECWESMSMSLKRTTVASRIVQGNPLLRGGPSLQMPPARKKHLGKQLAGTRPVSIVAPRSTAFNDLIWLLRPRKCCNFLDRT